MREMEASVRREGSTSPAPDWKERVETQIRRARDSATLLSSLLQDHAPGSPTRVLAEEIMSSISRALLVLDDCEKSAVPRTSNPSPPCSEVSSGKRKISPARRVYKSRSHPYLCTTITAKTIDDAYSWRKYGQKVIYNAAFPRSYYRCTHKPDRGCQATRQVQQSEEDPTMFVITYMSEHTCKSDPNKASTSGSYSISFGSGTTEPMMLAPLPLPKLDSQEEVVSSASPPDSLLSEKLGLPEITAIEAPAPSPTLPLLSQISFDFSHDSLKFEELGLPEIMAIEAPAPSPTLPLLSQISFDFFHDYWKLDSMSNNEFMDLDEMLNFENHVLS